jgi:sirohydrochlorin cobaltochelatase
MKKRNMTALLAGALLAATIFTGCGSTNNDAATETTAETADAAQDETAADEAADDENYDTGDASLDNPRNDDGIGENELLVVSFGTSYNDSRRLTIGAIEEAMEATYPDWSVRRAFTSQIIIDHVKSRDGEVIDNVGEALDRAVANGVKTLVVQPTHLMEGLEYNDVVDEIAQYSDAFDQVSIGKPLLSSDEDFQIVMDAIVEATAEYDDGQTAICFMGHGTTADSNEIYSKMQDTLTAAGHENYFVGTVEASPSLDDVLAKVQEGGYTKVVLEPLMIVAGDHANNDMAGDDEDSWKTTFENAGYEVECLVRGLGELPEIQQLLVQHAQEAMDEVTGSTTDKVASADDMVTPEEVVEEGMEPIYGTSLKDGTYDVTVDSSSSMFNIVSCKLTVANGKMSAVMTMGGTGYLYLYMGTGEEAAKADESDFISFVENENGEHTFEIPVEALDAGIDCAAFSKRKEMWYDRVLCFRADSLPTDAFADGAATTVDSLSLADGTYTVAVTLEGGSGKASVSSPTTLTVENGKAYALIVWSSPNYDYMVVDDVKYETVNQEIGLQGNSAFTIPVSGFDRKLSVKADTTAMSTPHEIDYTLYFDSSSIKEGSANLE